MISALLLWFGKVYIVAWVVTTIFFTLTGIIDLGEFIDTFGAVRGILYFIFITAITGLGIALLITVSALVITSCYIIISNVF